jgi:hypothetical protein
MRRWRMSSEHDELSERRLGRMLNELAADTPAPAPDELARLARVATATPRRAHGRHLRAAVPTLALAAAAAVAVGIGVRGGEEGGAPRVAEPTRTDLVYFPEGDAVDALIRFSQREERP